MPIYYDVFTLFAAVFLSRIWIITGFGGAGTWSVDPSLSQPIIFDAKSESSDNYGSSVALYENVMVVGAHSARLSGSSVPSGKAYIYRRQSIVDQWVREAELFIANSTNQDFFGWSVAVESDVVAVGAYMASGDTASVGLVYVYIYVDPKRKWVLQRILGSSGTFDPFTTKKINWNDQWGSNRINPDFDYFGWDVSIANGTIVVGTYGDDQAGSFSGCSYVVNFKRNTSIDLNSSSFDGIVSTWGRLQKITASDMRAFKNFGWSVAMNTNLIVVGAYGDVVGDLPYAGSVYIFNQQTVLRRQNAPVVIWSQTAKLVANERARHEYFGWSVAACNGLVAVGSHRSSLDEKRSDGAVYLFSKVSGTDVTIWTQRSRIESYILDTTQYFGYSLSMNNEFILIGASGGNSFGGRGGCALLYSVSKSETGDITPVREAIIRPVYSPSKGVVLDHFVPDYAKSISIYGSDIIVGAGRGDGVSAETGVVYIYTTGLKYYPVGASTYDFLVYFLPGGFALFLVTSFIFVQIGNLISDKSCSFDDERGELLATSSRHTNSNVESTEQTILQA